MVKLTTKEDLAVGAVAMHYLDSCEFKMLHKDNIAKKQIFRSFLQCTNTIAKSFVSTRTLQYCCWIAAL